jgi:hypothetical protein
MEAEMESFRNVCCYTFSRISETETDLVIVAVLLLPVHMLCVTSHVNVEP